MNNVVNVISVLWKLKINVKVWRHFEPEVVVRALTINILNAWEAMCSFNKFYPILYLKWEVVWSIPGRVKPRKFIS